MAKAKMRFRHYVLLFCVGIFILTAAGLAVLYYGILGLFWFSFWFMIAYVVAWILMFAFAVDVFVGYDKFGAKKILLVAIGVMLISAIFTHSVWTIVTPRWSFSVSTDKSTYRLGEDVRITVSLRNMGLISHSFRSASSSPVVVSVEYQYTENPTRRYQVWYSSISRSVTEFSVRPEEILERNAIWNQTNTANPWSWNQTYMPGTYWINAFIPKDTAEPLYFDKLFSAWTTMNVTSG